MKKVSDNKWKKILTEEQYHILREKGTEKPFTGKLLNNKEKGMYHCAACGNKLFASGTKFDSKTGWPSFYEMENLDSVELEEDTTLGMRRVEVKCKKCGSHLGHVFNDAPQTPTGKRFCINSCSLNFKKGKK